MRGHLLLALLLVATAAAGCFGNAPQEPPREVMPADVGYDPTQVDVTGTRLDNVTIPSFDGNTKLAALVRVPLANTSLPDGAEVRWPVVVFLHGWGGGKESFAGGRGGVPGSEAAGGADRLREYAEAGFIAVAYDARGFGQSTGFADVAGVGTRGDLGSVLDWVAANYPTSGRVGLLGTSYGAGQALLAFDDPRVTTIVPLYGWVDLYGSLIPNNVPKLEWAQLLYSTGIVGAHGRYDATVHDWYRQLYLRDDLDRVRAQMDERSAGSLAAVDKPLFLCQGLQETLFPQADIAAQSAAGFTRTYIYTGGHGSANDVCWSRAMDWFHFFLAGFDTRVDDWPVLETVDATSASGDATVPFDAWPAPTPTTYHLRAPDLVTEVSDATFTIRQSLSGGLDPSALPDLLGGTRPPIPEPLRQDPSAVVFTTPPLEGGGTLSGAPVLTLNLRSGAPPFQVAAELLVVHPDGASGPLGHTAYAALDTDDASTPLRLRFEWTHATLQPGDRIQLRVTPNDPGWWMPLLADYSVTFDGASTLELPLTS